MMSLVYKLLFSCKRIKKRVKDIAQMAFAIIGTMITIAETAVFLELKNISDTIKNHFWYGFLFAFVIALIVKWDRLKLKEKIMDSPDVTITLQVANVMKKRGAIIIPTNTTFDTCMDDDFISKSSVQGQYQIKYYKDKLKDLDKDIEIGLQGKDYIDINDGRNSKTKRYPIGTVCRISRKGKHAYFLADSDINVKGNAIDAEASDIAQALISLWDNLVEEGNQETYNIPLLGTGKARVKDVCRDEAIRMIILTFLAATKERKITDNLVICIHPKDVEHVHWDDLCEFLKYKTRFANIKPLETKPLGTAEKTPQNITYKKDNTNIEYIDKTEKTNDIEISAEREILLMTLLTGNKMDIKAIAAFMGLSLDTTAAILQKLVNKHQISMETKGKITKYYKSVYSSQR